MPAPERRLLFTCEHGGNRVPKEHRALFSAARRLLASHRGFDAGALPCARALARAFASPLIAATTTRLLVDLNRSPSNPRVFSAFTRALPNEKRAQLLRRYHEPHWSEVRGAIASNLGVTVHIAVHSFTPVLADAPRLFTVGFLYDPKRAAEKCLALEWQRQLAARLPRTELRRNAPYRGNSDGLTTAMRREFAAARYVGLELELNQQAVSTPQRRRTLVAQLASTLREALRA